MSESLKCPRCESSNYIRNGFQTLKDGYRVQVFKCKNCGMNFRQFSPRRYKMAFTIGDKKVVEEDGVFKVMNI
jgi:transposase-like protein